MERAIVDGVETVVATHHELGTWHLTCEGADELLFTENETNLERLDGIDNRTPYVKDGFDTYLVHGRGDAVNPAQVGTKAAAHYDADDRARGDGRRASPTGRCRHATTADRKPIDGLIEERRRDADAFYNTVIPATVERRTRRCSCDRRSPGCSGRSRSTATTSVDG